MKVVSMRKTAAVALAALLSVAMVGSASAGNKAGYDHKGNGKGYGKLIKKECGVSFGQLRKMAPHPVTPSKSARYFVESGELYEHCEGGEYRPPENG
jgi:hypothetical protein